MLAALALAMLLFVSVKADATGSHNPPAPTPNPASANSSSTSAAAAVGVGVGVGTAKSSSNATGGKASAVAQGGKGGSAKQSQGQQQGQVAHGGAASSDDSIVIEAAEAPRIPVATAIAGGTNTTASCRYSVGAGGQAAVAGVSIGWGRKDKDCERYELAQFFYRNGNVNAGDILMCQIGALKKAFGSGCLAAVRVQVVAPAYPPGEVVRRQERVGFPGNK